MTDYFPTGADSAVRECLEANRSFALIAGAGSGKTTSLVAALDEIRSRNGRTLRQNGQRIACITYTNRAVDVIRSRLGFDDLYHISTLHSFLWGEVVRFQQDLKVALQTFRIPALLVKAREKDTGRDTQEARRAHEQVVRLEAALAGIAGVSEIKYDDSRFSDYLKGQLSHDDVIEVSGHLLAERPKFRRLLGLRYPYIFVDEAQDTFMPIVNGLNLTCGRDCLPLVGYFGDPWQQIYEGRAGNFAPPPGGRMITKVENFRCSSQVIAFLNAFRLDVQQVPAGKNKDVAGSVEIRLVQAEVPEGARGRYSETQVKRALNVMDSALVAWGWAERKDVIRLFLVRQMIAMRLGFSNLHQVFTGPYASARAQDDYESGEHYLLSPFLKTICPLIVAYQNGESRKVIDILRENSPAYSTTGPNASRTLKEMVDKSKQQLQTLSEVWKRGTIKEVLVYCRDHGLLGMPDRLRDALARGPRPEKFDEALHGEDKGDWLADCFLAMPTVELHAYCDFVLEHTAYSTQHGVKGEQYRNVMVVFDDVEAAWNLYSFTKLLTPKTAGEPTEGQRERCRKLAYVCFSRARENLRILLFTPKPAAARQELIDRLHLRSEQITIA
jgi:DNA helicase-2/ATP-dependent DNA helicase PcrA